MKEKPGEAFNAWMQCVQVPRAPCFVHCIGECIFWFDRRGWPFNRRTCPRSCRRRPADAFVYRRGHDKWEAIELLPPPIPSVFAGALPNDAILRRRHREIAHSGNMYLQYEAASAAVGPSASRCVLQGGRCRPHRRRRRRCPSGSLRLIVMEFVGGPRCTSRVFIVNVVRGIIRVTARSIVQLTNNKRSDVTLYAELFKQLVSAIWRQREQ
jgi:hypothetical protein